MSDAEKKTITTADGLERPNDESGAKEYPQQRPSFQKNYIRVTEPTDPAPKRLDGLYAIHPEVGNCAIYATPETGKYNPRLDMDYLDRIALPYYKIGLYKIDCSNDSKTGGWAQNVPVNPLVLYNESLKNTIAHYVAEDKDLSMPQAQRESVSEERSAVGHLLFLRPHLNVLAEYAKQCDNESGKRVHEPLEGKELKALLAVLGYVADNKLGPEFLTRFVNPTGAMAQGSYNDGVNMYFAGLVHLNQMVASYWQEHISTVKSFSDGSYTHPQRNFLYNTVMRPEFFLKNGAILEKNLPEKTGDVYVSAFNRAIDKVCLTNLRKGHKYYDTHTHDFGEAARLLGLGALQWGFDKGETDQALHEKMSRFYRYLFTASGLDLAHEQETKKTTIQYHYGRMKKANGEVDKYQTENFTHLVCDKDIQEIAKYPSYVMGLDHPLKAEIDLAERISQHKDMLENWSASEPVNTRISVARVPNGGLKHEAPHAVKYLLSAGGEGQKRLFSR